MPHHVERVSWEALRAEVDASKSQWLKEGMPGEALALMKRLLAQVGAWEIEAANQKRRADDAESAELHIVVDVGCLECGIETQLRGIFTDAEYAHDVVMARYADELDGGGSNDIIVLTGKVGTEYPPGPED